MVQSGSVVTHAVANLPHATHATRRQSSCSSWRRQAERGQERVPVLGLQAGADGRHLRAAPLHLPLQPVVDELVLPHRRPADHDALSDEWQLAPVARPARRLLRFVEFRRYIC